MDDSFIKDAAPSRLRGVSRGDDGAGLDDLIVECPEGLYCPPGDFHIDP